jgi:hypothetical protein
LACPKSTEDLVSSSGTEPAGWIARLVAALERAVFMPGWAPTLKIVILLATLAGLYIAVRLSVP